MTFDTLDFVAFSGQQWIRLYESHSKEIIVTLPYGHHTNGMDRNIQDLKAMFVYAPDTRIKRKIRTYNANYACQSINHLPDLTIPFSLLPG